MIDLCQVDINVCAEQTWRRRCDILFQVRESSQSDDLMRIRHMGVVVVLKVLCILENLLNPVSCIRAQVSYLQHSQACMCVAASQCNTGSAVQCTQPHTR